MDQHCRQTKLTEVGGTGQARIARARVDVRLDGAAADVAARYLAGAGVAGVRVRDRALAEAARTIAPGIHVDVDPTLRVEVEVEDFGLRDPACRDLARGAHAALRALRAALEEDS
ncbi:MAG: hypothetical protein M3O46_16570 [Myxococcota bacterium]|nr:hypothetical protein [Myxococcota bacterium]